MEEQNNPEPSASPEQPDEDNLDWVNSRLLSGIPSAPEDGGEAIPPKVETLAEKHKARRQSFRQLVSTGNGNDETEPVDELLEAAPTDQPDDDLQEHPADLQQPAQEMSLLEAMGQKGRNFAKGVGRQARVLSQSLSQRFTRQKQPLLAEESVQAEEPVPQARPARRLQNVWPRMRPILWRNRLGPAFWTVASVLSLVVNIVLIVVLILLGRQLFFLKNQVVNEQLVNGLYDNFVLMDQAHIQTTILVSDTIQVKDTIPVVFDLPLSQKTMVVLTQDTPMKNATIYLNGVAVPLDLVLRQGTELNIKLDMSVPVNTTIPVVLNVPVNLQVPVDIPLDQTQLHKPFVGLQQVVLPFRKLLAQVPASWNEVCKGPMKLFCTLSRFK